MRKKGGRGGYRKGAGRKKVGRRTYAVRLTDRQAALLCLWGGGDMSAGLRWLIDGAAPLIGPSTVVLRKDNQ